MEYMASGTPTIMYKLPGLPIEYRKNTLFYYQIIHKKH